jgi:hypothetical protein
VPCCAKKSKRKKGEFVEPHTDEKGGLKGKFEDYSYTPKEEVWDRIAVGPGERPLGAMFWAFTWMPHARVWKRVSAELHPVPYMRIARWSAAAAAAIALFAWLQFGGAGAGENAGNGLATTDKAVGKHLATMDMQGCWTDRPAFAGGNSDFDTQGAHLPKQAGNKIDARDLAGSNPLAVKDMHSPQPKRLQDPPRQDLAFNDEIEGSGGSVYSHPLRKVQPVPLYGVTRPSFALATSLQDINRRTTQIAALDAERQKMAQAEHDAALLAWEEQQRRTEPAALMAQAGASLSGTGAGPGNGDQFQSIRDYRAVYNLGMVENLSDKSVSDENFHSPIVIGAMVDHRVWGGLGLGGGLVYTHMRSYQYATLVEVAQQLDVTRQYLGLAANLNYNLPLSKRNDRVALFGTTGLQYDFGLAKQVTLTTMQAGFVVNREAYHPKLGGQASVNAGLGLRYKLYKNIGLYAQANAARYFYATEANLYTGRLAWPSMQVGLRVRL